MTPNKQVSPAIRILRGERDASARATHLEAATRKFLVTTNERKQMSTTTNFKRIALVAVAALGFGTLSAIPASADVSGVTISVTNGATSLAGVSTTKVNSDTGTATGASITVSYLTTAATDSVTVGFYAKNALSSTSGLRAYLGLVDTTTTNSKVSTAGVGAFSAMGKLVATTADSVTAGVSGTSGIGLYSASDAGMAATTRTTGNVGSTFALFIDTNSVVAGAGTYTWTVVVTQYVGTTAANMVTKETSADVSIVVAAGSSASTTPSSGFTGAFIAASSTAVADATITPALATASTTAAAYINVDIKNASDTRTAQDTVTISIAGAGLLYDGSSYGTSLVGYQTGLKSYSIVPDGRAGTATITIALTRTGQSFTKTMTFYAAAAATNTLAATVRHPVLKIGANSDAVQVAVKDAAGNPYSGTVTLFAVAAADALVAGSTTVSGTCTWTASVSAHRCSVEGVAPGTAKLKAYNASTVAASTASSNEVTVTVSNSTAATAKIAFNKATYAPNERAIVTVTVLDSAGKPLPAQTFSNLFTTGGITTTAGITGDTMTAVSVTTAAATSSTTQGAGSAYVGTNANAMTYYIFMPAAGGAVTLTATGGTSLPVAGQVAITASATVTDSAASALAAVTALATTVASLKTLITTLTNLVLKIQKKVKA